MFEPMSQRLSSFLLLMATGLKDKVRNLLGTREVTERWLPLCWKTQVPEHISLLFKLGSAIIFFTMKMTVYLALISDCSTEFILAMEMDLMWSQLKALVYAVKALLADVACNSLMGSLMISWQSG